MSGTVDSPSGLTRKSGVVATRAASPATIRPHFEVNRSSSLRVLSSVRPATIPREAGRTRYYTLPVSVLTPLSHDTVTGQYRLSGTVGAITTGIGLAGGKSVRPTSFGSK